MTKRLLVLSLGRILSDGTRVEPEEAYAVVAGLQQLLLQTRDVEGTLARVPSLDDVGLTAFGDLEVRRTRSAPRVAPVEVSRGLAALLLRLLASGRTELDGAAAAYAAVARRAMAEAPVPGEMDSPAGWLAQLAALRPRDASAALAAVYARWMRTTDVAHAPILESVTGASTVAPGLQRPRDTADRERGPIQPSDPLATAVPAVTASPGRAAPGRRWPAVAAVAALVLVPLLWTIAPPPPDGGEPTAAGAPPASAPPAATPPAGAPPRADASFTEEPGAAVAAAPRPTRQVRTRRVLHAATAGRVPYSPSFDPQTRDLVFHAGLDRTALLEASLDDAGEVDAVRTVREDGSRAFHAQVSPDGTQLAFDSDVDGSRGIYVARRDGSAPRRVSGGGTASVPTWSPDGDTIAFTRVEANRPRVWNVWTVHLPTGRLRRETSHRVGQAWGASWFPDGRQIAYSVEDRLVVLDRETQRRRTFRTPVPNRLVRTPAVSPDGSRIVFQVHGDGAWVLDVPSGETRRLLADRTAQEFAWAPDGQQIAYHSVRGGGWGIWLMDLRP